MNWRGDEVKAKFRAQMFPRVERAVENQQQHAKQLVGTQYPPASSPGESPHRRSGELQDGIEATVADTGDSITGAMGTSVPHGRYTEQGTEKMAARPWCVKTLEETREETKQILGAK